MRVVNFWRCQHDADKASHILQNWVFIDMPELILQMGIDLFQEAARLSASSMPWGDR